MISYSLACDAGHSFESWFPSSGSYDDQVARGLVTCPVCGSAGIAKRIMAPAIARKDRGPAGIPVSAGPEPEVSSAPPQPVAILSEREKALRTMLREIREHVTRTADNVGERFADEARRMHYGEIEHRSIYGAATAADARDLIEEGITFQPLPPLPDEHN